MGPEDHIQADLSDAADTLAGDRGNPRKADPGRGPAGRAGEQCRDFAQRPDGARLGTLDTQIDDWKWVFQVNFFASIMLARGLLGGAEEDPRRGGQRHLHRRQQGASLRRGRLCHLEGGADVPDAGDGDDSARYGIRVNAISPGEIDTSILSPGTEKIVEEQIPMRRLGKPAEVAKAIYFLCSDASSYVNGAELHINGGQHV